MSNSRPRCASCWIIYTSIRVVDQAACSSALRSVLASSPLRCLAKQTSSVQRLVSFPLDQLLQTTHSHHIMPNPSRASFVLVNDGRQDTTPPPVAPEKVAEVEAKDRSITPGISPSFRAQQAFIFNFSARPPFKQSFLYTWIYTLICT